MNGSEFTSAFAGKSITAIEAAAFELVRAEQNPRPVMVPVVLSHKDGRTAVVDVSTDYFGIGSPNDPDFFRLPLLPVTAQKIANLHGLLLPTPRLVYRIWQASTIKLERRDAGSFGESNKGPNFSQYVKHNAVINAQLAGLGDISGKLISGHKKDVVVGNAIKPATVLIFGWYKPEPDVFDDKTPYDSGPKRQPQQVYSNAHGDSYADYSHGIRLVSPLMRIEGKDVETEKVFTDAALSDFVSHEGPVRRPRYPAPFPASVTPPPQAVASLSLNPNELTRLGTRVLIEMASR